MSEDIKAKLTWESFFITLLTHSTVWSSWKYKELEEPLPDQTGLVNLQPWEATYCSLRY